jgi:hypothetical protein
MSEAVETEKQVNPPAEPAGKPDSQQAGNTDAGLAEKLKSTLESYRALVRRVNPDILPEMITGDSPEEIEQSLARAQSLVEKIKSRLLEKIQAEQVPAGVTRRDMLEDLLPEEKIRRGVEK